MTLRVEHMLSGGLMPKELTAEQAAAWCAFALGRMLAAEDLVP